MAKYQAYAEYKDSGAEWLGSIPKHWSVEYSKWLFEERNNKANVGDEMLTASQKYGVIPQKMFMELEQQKVVQVQLGHEILKHAEVNDFVISMRSFQGGIEYCGYKGAVSSAYVPLKPRQDLSLSYYRYLFKSIPYIQALQTTTNLVRDGQALRFANFIQVRIPLLPYSEAEKIGQFLDHETAKIDHLIEKQQQLIELLKEKRQAVISHAVTKGLDPNVPMKDSGVEWLGEVPEHWKILNLRWKINIASGEGISSSEIESEPDFTKRIPVIGGNGIMGFTNKSNTTSALAIGRVGALCGNVHLINYESWITDNALKISQWNDFDSSYLVFLLKAARLNDMANKSAQPLITGEQIKSLRIVIPPLEEQKSIVLKIEGLVRSFDHLVEKAQSAIKLMQERRTALISAAVTGKIDVRNWQAPTVGAHTELSA